TTPPGPSRCIAIWRRGPSSTASARARSTPASMSARRRKSRIPPATSKPLPKKRQPDLSSLIVASPRGNGLTVFSGRCCYGGLNGEHHREHGERPARQDRRRHDGLQNRP